MSENKRPFFYRETKGIRISVQPMYLPEHSHPLVGQYVFAYFVRLENVSQRTVQLLTRYWLIHDNNGEEYEVRGEGVVGEQPILEPGQVHEYNSFSVLKSAHGWMEGSYRFVSSDETVFDAFVPRFELHAPFD